MGITNGINPVEIWLFKPKHLYSDRKRLRETCFLGALCLQSEVCEAHFCSKMRVNINIIDNIFSIKYNEAEQKKFRKEERKK